MKPRRKAKLRPCSIHTTPIKIMATPIKLLRIRMTTLNVCDMIFSLAIFFRVASVCPRSHTASLNRQCALAHRQRVAAGVTVCRLDLAVNAPRLRGPRNQRGCCEYNTRAQRGRSNCADERSNSQLAAPRPGAKIAPDHSHAEIEGRGARPR